MANTIIAYFDVDNFKIINDEEGHDVADEVMEEVTRIGKQLVDDGIEFERPYSDGDEFVIRLLDYRMEDAKGVVESFIGDIQSDKPLGFDLEFSVGIAEGDAGNSEEIRSRAEDAMRYGKRLGGNQIVISGEEPDLQEVKFRFEGSNIMIEPEDEIVIEEWRKHGNDFTQLEASLVRNSAGTTFRSQTAGTMMTVPNIEGHPIHAIVTSTDHKRNQVIFKANVKSERLEELEEVA